MKLSVLTLVLSLVTGAAMAGPLDVAGRWETPDKESHIVIEDCGDGTPCGSIAWFTPPAPEAKDVNNPDESLRSRPILGLTILSDFKKKGDQWKGGTIYDPEAGKSYASKLKLTDDDTLEVKGCIAFLCQSQYWTRVEQVASE